MEPIVIVGIGEADISGGVARTALGLNAQAASRAVADSGLTWDAIDGVLAGSSLVEPHYMFSTALCEYLGTFPRHQASVVLGGATPAAMIAIAAAALRAGECDYCLVVYGDSRGSAGASQQGLAAIAGARDHLEFERPYGMPAAGAEAMMAQLHMSTYGTTRQQLAEVAVVMSRHAALNPDAVRREPLTVDDVVRSRLISAPLRALDCALVTDFGGALILTTERRARDLPRRPVTVAASCSVMSHKYVSQARDLISYPVRPVVDAMFGRAQLSHDDVDVAMIYDGFTISVILNLEDAGFCPKGSGGAYIADGNVSLGGPMPINTHGGMLSGVHGGVQHILEAVKQLRGECGERQVPDARVAFVHGDGASQSTHSFALLTTG